MPDQPTQKLLPFGEVTVESTSPPLPATGYEPSGEVLAACERLEGWLLDARGRPQTEVAEQTLRAVAKALIEGKNGWVQAAEDGLEVLKLRNGKTEGDDIPLGAGSEDGDFQQAIEDVLDAIHERMLRRGVLR